MLRPDDDANDASWHAIAPHVWDAQAIDDDDGGGGGAGGKRLKKGHLLRLRHAYPLSASESGYDRLHAMREKMWDEVLVLRKRPGNECGE